MFKIKLKAPEPPPSEAGDGDDNLGSPRKSSGLKREVSKRKQSNDGQDNRPAKIRVKAPSAGSGGPKPAPRISISLNGNNRSSLTGVVPRIKVRAARQHGQGYDSEAPDREDEPIIEEGLILRMQEGEDLGFLHKAVEEGDFSKISLKFKDQKRAVITVNGHMYAAKLVDLPCIIESQKTFDRKNCFKTTDISQMLLVTNRISSEDTALNIPVRADDLSFPHGITPPLFYARKRRFRKRVSNKTIEYVENQVDKLLEADAAAMESKYDLLDPTTLARESSVALSERDGTPFDMLGGQIESLGGDEDGRDASEDEDLLGQELERAMEGDEDDENEDEDEEEDDEDEEDEDEDEALKREGSEDKLGTSRHNDLLREEIEELETTIKAKERDAANASNPILRGRFMDVVKKLQLELETKRQQLEGDMVKNAASNNKGGNSDNDNNNDNNGLILTTAATTPARGQEDDDEDEDDEEDDEEQDLSSRPAAASTAVATTDSQANEDGLNEMRQDSAT